MVSRRLYLNQGHSFFAPEVGPGHIIRYELFDQSGRVVEQGELPNRKEHWPRLRYHRHFMLADQAGLSVRQRAVPRLLAARSILEGLCPAFACALTRTQPAVRVRRIAHWPLPRDVGARKDGSSPIREGYETADGSDAAPQRPGPAERDQIQSSMWQRSG